MDRQKLQKSMDKTCASSMSKKGKGLGNYIINDAIFWRSRKAYQTLAYEKIEHLNESSRLFFHTCLYVACGTKHNG